MEWAKFGLKYLYDARVATQDVFNETMKEVREQATTARREVWYRKCKDVIQALYHYSQEFVSDLDIPGGVYGSPQEFGNHLLDYKSFVDLMLREITEQENAYEKTDGVHSLPFLLTETKARVRYIIGAIDYVEAKRPLIYEKQRSDRVTLLEQLCSRFHESVLALRKHPHGGTVLTINDEWDCQYLFRVILAAYFRDFRIEEWNPSVAGSSARCEFFLKSENLLVELKYVRDAKDQKKIKQELATDILDYGANPEVDYVIVLVYDPGHHLPNPVSLQTDLSGPNKSLKNVHVIVSPPR